MNDRPDPHTEDEMNIHQRMDALRSSRVPEVPPAAPSPEVMDALQSQSPYQLLNNATLVSGFLLGAGHRSYAAIVLELMRRLEELTKEEVNDEVSSDAADDSRG